MVPGVDDDRLRGSDEVAVVPDLRGHLQPLLVHLEHDGGDPVPGLAAVAEVGGEGEDVLVPGAHELREEDIEGEVELRPPLDGADYGQVGSDQGGGAAGPGGLCNKNN